MLSLKPSLDIGPFVRASVSEGDDGIGKEFLNIIWFIVMRYSWATCLVWKGGDERQRVVCTAAFRDPNILAFEHESVPKRCSAIRLASCAVGGCQGAFTTRTKARHALGVEFGRALKQEIARVGGELAAVSREGNGVGGVGAGKKHRGAEAHESACVTHHDER